MIWMDPRDTSLIWMDTRDNSMIWMDTQDKFLILVDTPDNFLIWMDARGQLNDLNDPSPIVVFICCLFVVIFIHIGPPI